MEGIPGYQLRQRTLTRRNCNTRRSRRTNNMKRSNTRRFNVLATRRRNNGAGNRNLQQSRLANNSTRNIRHSRPMITRARHDNDLTLGKTGRRTQKHTQTNRGHAGHASPQDRGQMRPANSNSTRHTSQESRTHVTRRLNATRRQGRHSRHQRRLLRDHNRRLTRRT